MSVELERWLAASQLHQRLSNELVQESTPCYLVGGTVRDLLLGRASRDVDLAVAHDALAIGRRLANRLGGAFVPLDVERDVARVVLGRGEQSEHIDLTGFRGNDLVADLRARDFTVNAMAIGLSGDERGRLFDPTGGREHLQCRCLRLPDPQAMRDDPLRLLRGLRIAAMLGFRLDAQAWTASREAVSLLGQVSAERVRDEFLQMLQLDDVATLLGQAHDLGALATILPGVEWDGSYGPALETLAHFGAGEGTLWQTLLPDSEALLDDAGRPIAGDRIVWSTVMLAGLLSLCCVQAPDACARSAATRLALSRRESQLLSRALNAIRGEVLSQGGQPADDLALHRLFRAYGWAAAVAALLSGATAIPLGEVQDDWRIARSRRVLATWYRRYAQVVSPPQLVSGADLMRELGIEPGPRVGCTLRVIQEGQVLGLVNDAQQALQFARRKLCDAESAG